MKKLNSLYLKVLLTVIIVEAVALLYYLIFLNDSVLGIVLSVILIAIQLLGIKLQKQKRRDILQYILLIVEYVCILALFFKTSTGIEGFVLFLYTIRVVILIPITFGLIVSILGYAGYVVIWEIGRAPMAEILLNSLTFFLWILSISGTKLLLKQRDTIFILNQKILEQSSSMERLAVIEERNRIAKNMHDTVGHTLTTAILSMEGAEVLMNRDVVEAKKKIKLAKQQLKQSLGDIRKVVKQLKDDTDPKYAKDLESILKQLVLEVEQNTSIKVSLSFELEQPLLSLQNYVIYNAVKEAITNSIKHSNVSIIHIRVNVFQKIVNIEIINDGYKGNQIIAGFGLQTMQESVEAIGGRLMFDVFNEEHFRLHIQLPEVKEEAND